MPIRGTICSYLFVPSSGQQDGLDFKAPSRLIQRICFSAALNNFTFQVSDISEVVPQLPLDDLHDFLDRVRILVS
ncbi:hypothetical protein AAG906_013201 [Vitis piasezkii]